MRLLLLCFIVFVIGFSFKSHGQVSIFTSDIDNFWIAYDSIQSTKDTTKQLEFIQKLYLDKATDGLKEFIVLRDHSAKRHLKNILKYPKFWTSLRPHTSKIKSVVNDVEHLMVNFKKLYPKFQEPKVYFTIGVLNSGGTASPDKILIGSEIACSDKSVDASELNKWLQGVFQLNTSVVSMVAHELGHTQQKGEEDDSNLLGYCIREGACDFIAELLYKPIQSPYMTYGKANEKVLWTSFEKEMLGQETKNWLYNGSDAPNRIADLGYYMGYEICKSYYENSSDKNKAIAQIIELEYDKKSVERFLNKSKYRIKKK